MPKCPVKLQRINIKWKCSTSKNALAAHPPSKVLQSSHFIVKNFSVLSFFESFRCSAWISILLFTWASSAVLVNFCSFLPSPFFFSFVNNFFQFLYLILPSLLYHLRKKIQILWRDTRWKIWEQKEKECKD